MSKWWWTDEMNNNEAVDNAHSHGQKIGSEGRSRDWNSPVAALRFGDQAEREEAAYQAGYKNGRKQS